MIRNIAALSLVGGLWVGASTPVRWQFAGENHGIHFYFKIANECQKSGAKVEVKLQNTLDYPVTVSFRLVDPEWSLSFERELEAKAKDTAIEIHPESGSACHPYIDQVYLEPKEKHMTHSDEPVPLDTQGTAEIE